MAYKLKISFIVIFWLHAINLGVLPLNDAYTHTEFSLTEIEEDTHVFYDHEIDEKINTLFKISGGSNYALHYIIINFEKAIANFEIAEKYFDDKIAFYINQYRRNLLVSLYLPKLYILFHCAKDYLA